MNNDLEQQVSIMETSMEDLISFVEEAQAEKDRQLEAIAKQIEGKFTQDCSRRARKEREWILSEQLLMGSTFRFYGKNTNTDMPYTSGQMSSKDGYGLGYFNDRPEHNIVRSKLEIAKAQLEMLQFGAGTDKNFTIRSKDYAEDYQELQNQPAYHPDGVTPMQDEQGQPMTIGQLVNIANAKEADAAKQMDEEVFCQLSHAKYGKKMREGFDDLLLYGTAIYRGPINNVKTNKVRKQLQTSDGKSVWVTSYSETPAPDFEKIIPWLFYPDHRALCIEEAEHASVVHLMNSKMLRNLLRREGFMKDQITDLLKNKPTASYYQSFRNRAADYDNSDYMKDKYVVIEWHGTVGIDDLKNLNIDPPYENPLDVYRAEIWVCQGKVLYASLEMLEADDELPFAVSVWERDPSNFFGFGAILLRDAQRVVNKTYQMILDNAGLVALPQATINKEMVKPIDGKPEIAPGKVWYGEYPNTKAGDFVEFFTPPVALKELSGVLQMAKDFGNEESLIPLIQGGMSDPNIADAGATGMAMIMQASTSVLSSKAREWDDNITRKVVTWFYEWNMQYSDKEQIKGDYDVDVQTSTAYLNKVMGQRDIERLCLEYAQNPEVQDLVNGDELYRARLAGMNIPFDLIVRSQEEVDKIRQQRAQNQQPNPEDIKAQAALVASQAKMAQVENQSKQMEFDAQQGYEEAQMDHQEKMAQYAVRDKEQEARRLESNNQIQLQLLEMQQRHARDAERTMLDANKHVDKMRADKMKIGIKAFQDQQNLNIKEREMKVKEEEVKQVKKTGKGF